MSSNEFNLYNSSDNLSINLANIALESSSETLQRFSDVKNILHEQLQHFVSENSDDLLSEMTKLDEYEGYLHKVKEKVLSLMNCLNNLRCQLNQPYENIAHRILLLNRLHTTCDLVRRITRFMHLCKQIESIDLQSNDQSREVIKAAQCVSELNDLISQDDNLLKIEIIKGDLIHLGDKQNDILEIANSKLNAGLEKQDTNLIAISLHVYFYFDMLEEKIDDFCNQMTETINENIKNTFDLQEYSQSKASGPGSAVVLITASQATLFREKFWNAFENIMNQFCIRVIQLDLLIKTLKKKRDPNNQMFMYENLSKPISIAGTVAKILDELNATMIEATGSSNLMKEVLEIEFPKLQRIFTNVWTRLARDGTELETETKLRSILKPFEEAHKLRPVRQRWRAM